MKVFVRILVILGCIAHAAPTFSGNNEVTEPYFRISTPDGFTIAKIEAVEGDIFYTISSGGLPHVMIYVGNAPAFPEVSDPSDAGLIAMKTQDMSLLTTWSGEQIIAIEVLIVRERGLDWPRFVHA